MAKVCKVCDKGPKTANLVSHAKNRTKRWLYPNVHKMRFKYPNCSKVHAGTVCTKCVKKGKVEKVLSA
ncbi:50S ribosomal protein L28 [candidate division TM6 bacterium RIFCSPHIGHO2_12_FULL_36_22]|nr:MAG: 50S ribosomal protein L28 [candidate division TM6 bacterium RIFCSPHIGHO2_12_FULL_36_22]